MKKLISLSMIALLFLAACGGGESDGAATDAEAEAVAPATATTKSEESPTSTPTESVAKEEAPTVTPTQSEVAKSDQPAEASTGPAVCRVEPLGIAPNPGIAAVSEADWQHGAERAEVTIVEYGDFQ